MSVAEGGGAARTEKSIAAEGHTAVGVIGRCWCLKRVIAEPPLVFQQESSRAVYSACVHLSSSVDVSVNTERTG